VEHSRKLNIKYSRTQSVVTDIAAIMFYPTASPEFLPIFATEWVVIAKKCHALILDVETASPQPTLFSALENAFASLGEKWRAITPENRDRPAWFNDIAAPWAVYGTAPVEALPNVRAAFKSYLSTAMQDFYLPKLSQARSGPDHPAVTHYTQHHLENFPGRPLLCAKIGAPWTDEFLSKWHFGPPVRPASP
jgi:hypothetical protein